jgi:signal transduction histidine kinase
LGLSLVDEHVRMHGGRVWVEDRLDGESGARFVIEIMATELTN